MRRNGEEIIRDSVERYTDAGFTIDFPIKHCPNKLHKEFVELRKFFGENSNWMTLKILVENFKKGSTYELFAECLNTMDTRISSLEQMVKQSVEDNEQEDEDSIDVVVLDNGTTHIARY